ncbi:MAG: hypothetical protein ACOVRN_00915 [Flavobacterium sp.]
MTELNDMPQNASTYHDDDVDTLHFKLNAMCATLDNELAKTAKRIDKLYNQDICYTLRKLTENGITFDDHEIVEEAVDAFTYRFQKTKQLLKEARLIRCYIEQKTAQKENEIRFAKNALAQYGIATD